MALDKNGLAFLLSASGTVSFSCTATLGRQSLAVSERELRATVGAGALDMLTSDNGFCEPFLAWLGAREIVSVDASDYEGASVIHDLNTPIPDELRLTARFSAVIDGGTLEHVFDLPTALRSAASMVALGGHFLAIAPVNGLAGHGFYQLSPELYFGAFSEVWGFRVERMLLARVGGRRWFEVLDPAALGRRVAFSTLYPSFLYVCARRVSIEADLAAPQQSDYVRGWSADGVSDLAAGPTWRRWVPIGPRDVARTALNFCPRRLDRDAFKRVSPPRRLVPRSRYEVFSMTKTPDSPRLRRSAFDR
jgi:hypothetical protein